MVVGCPLSGYQAKRQTTQACVLQARLLSDIHMPNSSGSNNIYEHNICLYIEQIMQTSSISNIQYLAMPNGFSLSIFFGLHRNERRNSEENLYKKETRVNSFFFFFIPIDVT